MHYFSPVNKMPLLEVIATPRTAPEVIATAVALGKKQGKTVIIVGDVPGFYTNRVLGPYMNEAAWLLVEGAAIDELDAALVAFGYPVGPITLLDEVGIDVGAKVAKILHAGYGDRMKPPDALEAVLQSGRLGRKNGKGFYTYGEGKKKVVDETVYDLLPGGRSRKRFPRRRDGGAAGALAGQRGGPRPGRRHHPRPARRRHRRGLRHRLPALPRRPVPHGRRHGGQGGGGEAGAAAPAGTATGSRRRRCSWRRRRAAATFY